MEEQTIGKAPHNRSPGLPVCQWKQQGCPAQAVDDSVNFGFEIPSQSRALGLVPLLG